VLRPAFLGRYRAAPAAGVAARNPRIIVDLAALEYIDCSSLAALGQVGAGPGRPTVTCC
jgi:hypothetical protein